MSQTPTPAAPSLAAGEDTGRSNSDGITDIAMPTLLGRTLPNALVTIYDNDFVSIVGTATADANGNYDVVLSQVLNDGKNILTATATAPGSTESVHSAPLTITVDTAAPDLPTAPTLKPADDTGASALDGVTNKTVLHLTGRSEPGATVSLLIATVLAAGGAGPTLVLATATVAADGSYTLVTPTLADATYTFSVVATDIAGNTSKVTVDNPLATTSITVDTKPPAAPPPPTLAPGSDTGMLRTDGLTTETTPVVVGTTEANATVYLFDGDGTLLGHTTADGNGAYAITTKPLAEGSHLLGIKSVDAAGNVSAGSSPLAIVIDTTPATGTSTPVPDSAIFGSEQFALNFSEPVTGLTARSLSLTMTGNANGSIAAISGSGRQYVVTVEGLTGAGTISVGLNPDTVTDLAGNPVTLSTEAAYQVNDQTAPPPILIATLSSGAATDDVLSLSAGGRLVAFDSKDGLPAYDSTTGMLVEPGTAGNVYVRDVRTGALTLVSAGLAGAIANGASGSPKLSDDGRTIVFTSTATNLIANAPVGGLTNVYAAHLAISGAGAAEKIVVSGITLVSAGNGLDGIDAPRSTALGDEGPGVLAPSISADGSHIVFASDQKLIAGMSGNGIDNIFEDDLTTGALSLVSGGPAGTGALADCYEPTVSADGARVAYAGITPLSALSPQTAYGYAEVYVFDAPTGATTAYYGAIPLGIDTSTPPGGVSNVIDEDLPSISSDGNWLTYTIDQTDPTLPLRGSFVVEQSLKNPAVILALSPLIAGYAARLSSINQGGRYVAYTQSYDSIDFGAPPGKLGLVLDDTVTGTKTVFSPEVVGESVVSDDGDAVAYVTDPASGPAQIYLQPLGAVVQVSAVGDDDRFGAAAWRQVQTAGLLVSGTTNQANGAAVILTLSDAAGNVLSTLTKIPVASGAWSATIPAATLAPLSDGGYVLSAVADGPGGASFPAGPAFTVDTTPPDAPDKPALDPGSDSSLASDGTATNSDTPTLTGSAEAGATITLYDTASTTPTSVLGTATADANGVYAISPDAALINATYNFAVTATDAAGNVSALSSPDIVLVDTLAPDRPNAPTLAGAYVGAKGPVPASDTGASATDGITDTASPTFTGIAEAKSVVTLYDTDGVAVLGTATASATGTWSITPDNGLSDGSHAITVTATDAAGNASPHSAAETVVIDTLPPLMPVITSVAGEIVNGGSLAPLLTVNGTAEPGSTVALRLDGGMMDLGTETVGSDGEYTIDSDSLPAGAHMLAVVATDVAGNASQASLQVAVTIADVGGITAAGSIAGVAEDGYLSGATVFADANGNGVLDPGEATATTDAHGRFSLNTNATLPALVAAGGIDTMTGLTLPGPLLAPPNSTIVTALTTLLAHIASVARQPVSAALLAAEAQALGLSTSLDLQTQDPIAAANAGDPTGLIASAKIMDTAVALADVLAVQAGVTRAAAFAAALDALARAAIAAAPTAAAVHAARRDVMPADTVAAPALNLDDQATLQTILADAAGRLEPGLVLPDAVSAAATAVISGGNAALDSPSAATAGAAGLAYVAAVETVEQGGAAPALAAAGSSVGALGVVEPQYVSGSLAIAISAATEAAQGQPLGPPQLAPGSDTGLSDRDNIIDSGAPTFTGIAKPGTYVTLFFIGLNDFLPTAMVTGQGVADATGHYHIVAISQSGPFARGYAVGAIGSLVDPGPQLGDTIAVPEYVETIDVGFDFAASDLDTPAPAIVDATQVAIPADDATHTALYLEVAGNEHTYGEVQVFADGDSTPVATGSLIASLSILHLTTSPLALGAHTLTVTLTEAGGTVLAGAAPYAVTVAAPSLLAGTGRVLGGLAGAYVYAAHLSAGGISNTIDPTDGTTTGVGGSYLAQPDPVQEVRLVGGYDTLTGEPLGGASFPATNVYDIPFDDSIAAKAPSLLAPYDATTVNPLTTIQTLLDDGDYDPANNQQNAETTLAGLGLPTSDDLATLDPLALAQSGDPAALLETIKLVDTVTILAGLFNGFSFQVIADDLQNNGTLDLDSASAITAAMTAYYPTAADAGYPVPPLGQYPAIAAIIAAGNQAIDAHAVAAASVADIISYALAASVVAQEAETRLLRAATFSFFDGDPNPLPAIAAAYSGSALDALIEAERVQLAQARGFVPLGAATTGAATVVFAISFSRPVTGLSSADFTPVTGGDLAGVHVSGVVPVAGSDGAAYDVSVSTGIGQGSLALAFSGAGLASANGTPLTAGSFAPPTLYPELDGDRTLGLAVGDFNGDGRPDVIVTTGSDATLYLDQADGSLAAQPSDQTGFDDDGAVAVGDFNGDGKLDMVTLGDGGALRVWIGDGTGSFATPVQTIVPDVQYYSAQIAVGDFDGDGRADVAVSYYANNTVTIMLANGDGSFRVGETLATGSLPQNIVTADLNHDGHLDLVTPNDTDGTVSIFLGAGDGTFAAATPVAAGASPVSVAVGDLNGDGIPDIAVAGDGDGSGGSVTILLGHGDGRFTALAPLLLPSSYVNTAPFRPTSIVIGDVDNDGRPDLVVGGEGTIELFGNGDGTFRLGEQNPNGGGDPYAPSLALTDIDGDGRLDLLSTASGWGVNPDATFGLEAAHNIAQPVVGTTSPSVTIQRAAVADPVLTKASGPGTLSQVGNAYTLDLGAVSSAGTLVFALANAATGNADSFDGLFSAPTGTGFTITGGALPAAIAAGASYAGLVVTALASTLGTHTETITFAPRDASAILPTTTAPDGPTAPAATPSTVGLELAPITLTITDDVVAASSQPPAALGPLPAAINLPAVHLGAPDTTALTLTNAAATGAADLNVTGTASGAASLTGSVTALAPGAVSTALSVGLATSTAGATTGIVTLDPVSAPSTPLASTTITLSGAVYREASAGTIAPISTILHVGDPGTVTLTLANTDPADGYSEALTGTLASVSTGLTATTTPTGTITPGASATLTLAVPTTTAGTITGTAAVTLTSEGGTGATSLDGLGATSLGTVSVPVSVTVDNYADPLIEPAGVAPSATGTTVLDLGTLAANSVQAPLSLTALNAALAPADALDGSYTLTGPSAFSSTGFASFTDLAAGGTLSAGTLSLNTSTTGTFTETVVLHPTDVNATGYSQALPDRTVIVTADIVDSGIAFGDVHLASFDGLRYDMQSVGDFVLARSTLPGDPFEIQIRTAPAVADNLVSVTTEAAARVGTDLVSFEADGSVLIDGILDTALDAAHPRQLLAGGTLSTLGEDDYRLLWSSGEQLDVTNRGGRLLNLATALGPADAPGSVQGLLGPDRGAADAFTLPNGTVLPASVTDTALLARFADAWRVAPGASLLDGEMAQPGGATSPMTFLTAAGDAEVLTGSAGMASSGVASSGAAGGGVTISGTLQTLAGAVLADFGLHDRLDVAGATPTFVGGQIMLTGGAQTAWLGITGPPPGQTWHTAPDLHGGVLAWFS